MFLRKLLAFTVLLAGLLPSVSKAALFKDPVVINAAVGKALTLDMHSLLINPQLANVVMSSTGDMPGWMHLNTSTFVLTGTPAAGDAGVFTIHFNAVVNEAGDLNHPATLTVLGPPVWKQNPLNLGQQTETVPYRYVSVEGPVTLATPDLERDVRAMAIRYLGPEMGEMYLAMTAEERAREASVLVEMRPERWRSVDYGKMVG